MKDEPILEWVAEHCLSNFLYRKEMKNESFVKLEDGDGNETVFRVATWES